MSSGTRNILISLREPHAAKRTCYFDVEITSADGDVILAKTWKAVTNSSGAATLALPTNPDGTVTVNYRLPTDKPGVYSEGTFNFTHGDGSDIALSALMAAGTPASDSTIDYITGLGISKDGADLVIDSGAGDAYFGDVHQADTGVYFKVNTAENTGEVVGGSFSVLNGRITMSDGLSPRIEGVGNVGDLADPFAGAYFGTDNANNTHITSVATGFKENVLPNASGTFVVVNGLTLPVTIGANDSGGSGKRALVVDNA
jgi:hypothetical protein